MRRRDFIKSLGLGFAAIASDPSLAWLDGPRFPYPWPYFTGWKTIAELPGIDGQFLWAMAYKLKDGSIKETSYYVNSHVKDLHKVRTIEDFVQLVSAKTEQAALAMVFHVDKVWERFDKEGLGEVAPGRFEPVIGVEPVGWDNKTPIQSVDELVKKAVEKVLADHEKLEVTFEMQVPVSRLRFQL